MNIRAKLMLGFSIVFFFLLVIAGLSVRQNYENSKNIEEIRLEIIADTMLLMDLQKDVIQIQQWLSDVAATRAAEGFDDGFTIAEEYYESAKDKLTTLISGHQTQDESETVETYGAIRSDLDDYYRLGVDMAHTYISSGTEAGNRMMSRFDPYAVKLHQELESQVEEHREELKEHFAEIESRNRISMMVSISVSAIALLFVILLSIFLSRSITLSIQKLLVLSEQAATGDLTRLYSGKTKDEIAQLGSAFNSFINNLKELIKEIKEAADANMKIKQELIADTTETSSAVTQISGNIQSINIQVEKQNNEISTSNQAAQEVSDIVIMLRSEVETQAAMVEESSASINQMIASIESVSTITEKKKKATETLVKTAEIGGEKLTQTTEVVKEISSYIASIQEITEIIAGLASQTNLLSMNAAIEAAHAGESGKGFAVVADEIRKLAESSSDSSRKIGDLLKNMVDRIQQASTATSETETAFDEINREVIEVAEALTEINAGTQELLIGGRQITDAVSQLSDVTVKSKEGFDTIDQKVAHAARSFDEVNNISSIVKGAMDEMQVGIDEISQSMQNVSDLTAQLDSMMVKLTSQIDRFTLS